MRLFTSESVTEGHPDKVCDQVSDAVLDAMIEQEPTARVACETIVTTGMALVMGEITLNTGYVDIPHIVRKTIEAIGYNDPTCGFDSKSCAVITSIDEQSPDIAVGVDKSLEYKSSAKDEADLIGAGDQGMMFGFACNETDTYMPAAITYAHKLCRRLAAVRKEGVIDYLRPDGKAQITVQYGEHGKVERCEAIVVSTQHKDSVTISRLRDDVFEAVITPVIPKEWIDKDTKIFINPTGRFVVGGPAGDSGLTGRKLIVDTYGGYARHGGGSFSGKDPTKVDRSASYMARYAAKNLVAAGLADRCEIELAYAIGVARPVSVLVDTFGTGKADDARLAEIVKNTFDLRPAGIIASLNLRRPIFRQTAAYGHFGRDDIDLPWERLDKVAELKAQL
ncbi:MAG: methionine adenosyltransferase [Oscillospiraceae bacterium]|jgi:S-adenosylmethionine synthetase|nr:methionine adenosyltransferase [Oscillospiraceae bacterium]